MERNYAIQRNSKDELTHWKYIKREKGPNGKWKYYYDDPYANKKITRETVTTVYKNSNDILSDKSTVISDNTGNKTITKTRGALDRALGRSDGDKMNYIMNKTETVDVERQYKDVDSWLGGTTTMNFMNTNKSVITHERGKIAQAAAKAERWIFDKFLKK